MGVFSRKKVTEDVPVEEKRQEEAKTASSVKSVLEGSLLAEKLRQNIRFVLFATFLGIGIYPMDILLKSCIGRGFFWKRK